METKFRGSILLRKPRTPSRKNQENIDAEYEREQARLRAKQEKRKEVENERVMALFGTADEKHILQERRKREMEEQLRIRDEQKKQQLLQDLNHARQLTSHVHLNSMVETDQKEARKEYLRSLMDTNKQLMEEKKMKARFDKQMEIQDDMEREQYFLSNIGRNAR